jgi:hypothetical protein
MKCPQEIPHQQAPRVADTLTGNPNFIKAGFHIGRFITIGVDAEKEHALTDALKCNLEFTSEQIKVSISFHITVLLSILTPLFFQQLIEYSQSKDQYIRVALKRLTETQILDDELKEEKALNKALLARNQELETQLAAESREKTGKHTLSTNSAMPQIYSGLIFVFPCTNLHGAAHGTQCQAWRPGLDCQVPRRLEK